MHELEINKDGTANMFSGEGHTPWHGLGTVIEGLATAEEALQLAGLDWSVAKRPLYQEVPVAFDAEGKATDWEMQKVPDRFSVVRDSDYKSLGIVSKGYKPFQNEEAFAFMNGITDTGSGDAVFSTAGSLFGGARTFMTLRIGEEFTVAGGDAHKLFLMVSNSHDGSQALTAAITPIRVVCNNTVTMALAGAKTKWTLRHRVPLQDKVTNAREALEMSFKYEEAFQKEVEKMMEIEITKDKFYSLVDHIIPKSPEQHDITVDALMNIWENEPTVYTEGGKGNGYDAFNAVTFFTDHKEYRTVESKFNSIIGTGTGQGFAEALRPKAHKAILALAK
jgi:phage/plasmid-like protein (TIGR03299 family)